MRRNFRTNSSGQLLIVAALAVALLISSTTLYVFELSDGNTNAYSESFNDLILSLKQSTKHTIISSLGNVSNGGERTVVTSNFNELAQAFRELSRCGFCNLTYVLANDSRYDSGVWLSWSTSGIGVSSAYVDAGLSVYGATEQVVVNYGLNITTATLVTGDYTVVAGDEKLVNLTCNTYNEGKSALAKNITVYYENLGNWTIVDASNNLSIVDFGNGTYKISFNVNAPSSNVQVSVHVFDLREIFVQANITCAEA
jgi:hypothetical protein